MSPPTLRLVLILAVALPSLGCEARRADEPALASFRGGPDHAGVYAGETPRAPGGFAWRFATGGPVRSSPAVAGGTAYVGSGDGRLYAVDAEAGTELWSTALGSAISSSPAVTAETVVVAARDGTIVAVERATGALRWRVRTGPNAPLAWGFETGDVYLSSPVVAAGLVFVGAGDGHLYALDLASGRERWRLRTGGRVRSSPAVGAGIVAVGSMDGSVYAAAPESGRLLWRHDTEGRSLESGDYGFDRRTIQSSPAIVDGVVYVGSRDSHVYAIDARTGRLRWRVAHDGLSWAISSPAVAGGLVYTGSSDARFLHAVDAATGRERWRVPTERPVWTSPAIVGDAVVFGDGAGFLYAVDRRSGAELWRHRVCDRTMASPVPHDGSVLVGCDDGALYAVRVGGETLERAVFWDAALAVQASTSIHERLRDHLAERGYDVLDAAGLRSFLERRLADAARSVVVFAMDVLPPEVAPAAADTVLLRRYLAAAGKVVWVGAPPLIWPRDPSTGRAEYAGMDHAAPQALLAVDHDRARFDRLRAEATSAGRRWGLDGWWLSDWAVDPAGVTEVLARDEDGSAAAWVKSFGGAPGTGFVRVDAEAAGRDPDAVRRLAEHFPGGDGTDEPRGLAESAAALREPRSPDAP